MKNVIDLNNYKLDKENEVLLYLKERIKGSGKKNRQEFFSLWYKGCFFIMILQGIIRLFVEDTPKVSFTIELLFNFGLASLLIWIISKIFDKHESCLFISNHFKREKEKLISEKKLRVYDVILKLRRIMRINYSENAEYNRLKMHIGWHNANSFLSLIKSNEYKKFKYTLQKAKSIDYPELIKLEKKFIKLNNEINLLSNVSKEDLKKIS